MAKDINLYSQEWCDIVFEGKNQDYGAYQVRLTSTKRHVIALIAILILTVFVAFLPTIISQAKAAIEKARLSGFTEEIKMTQLDDVDLDIPDDFVPPELPPPPMIASIKFTAPEITKSEDMTDDDAMKAQSELLDSKAAVSIMDHKGDDDPNAVDARDLIIQKEIIQEENIIHTFVEQMPEFPGGIEELYAFIKKQLVYPEQARNYGIQGTTMIQFVVTKNGTIDQVTVQVGVHPLLDKEAVRVVKLLPRWIPGKMNGKSVNCYYMIPIAFKIN